MGDDSFWVAVVMDVNGPDTQSALLKLSNDNLMIFQQQPGFCSGKIMQSHDGRKVVSLIQWATEADHLACLQDQIWQTQGHEWLEMIHQGKARMEVITLALAGSAEPLTISASLPSSTR
jgi:hypothetical protein